MLHSYFCQSWFMIVPAHQHNAQSSWLHHVGWRIYTCRSDVNIRVGWTLWARYKHTMNSPQVSSSASRDLHYIFTSVPAPPVIIVHV